MCSLCWVYLHFDVHFAHCKMTHHTGDSQSLQTFGKSPAQMVKIFELGCSSMATEDQRKQFCLKLCYGKWWVGYPFRNGIIMYWLHRLPKTAVELFEGASRVRQPKRRNMFSACRLGKNRSINVDSIAVPLRIHCRIHCKASLRAVWWCDLIDGCMLIKDQCVSGLPTCMWIFLSGQHLGP